MEYVVEAVTFLLSAGAETVVISYAFTLPEGEGRTMYILIFSGILVFACFVALFYKMHAANKKLAEQIKQKQIELSRLNEKHKNLAQQYRDFKDATARSEQTAAHQTILTLCQVLALPKNEQEVLRLNLLTKHLEGT